MERVWAVLGGPGLCTSPSANRCNAADWLSYNDMTLTLLDNVVDIMCQGSTKNKHGRIEMRM